MSGDALPAQARRRGGWGRLAAGLAAGAHRRQPDPAGGGDDDGELGKASRGSRCGGGEGGRVLSGKSRWFPPPPPSAVPGSVLAPGIAAAAPDPVPPPIFPLVHPQTVGQRSPRRPGGLRLGSSSGWRAGDTPARFCPK